MWTATQSRFANGGKPGRVECGWQIGAEFFSSKLAKAVDEIGERTRILVHESVATAIELSKPSARNGVNQLQRIGRRDHDIGRTAGGNRARAAATISPNSR